MRPRQNANRGQEHSEMVSVAMRSGFIWWRRNWCACEGW